MREKRDYREQIAIILGEYPGRATLSVTETAKVLGIDRRTVKSLIERRCDPLNAIDIGKSGKNKIYIIPVTAIARFTG